jgi:hypothetical protein
MMISAFAVRFNMSIGLSEIAPPPLLPNMDTSALSCSRVFNTLSRFFNGKPRSAIMVFILLMVISKSVSICKAAL